METVRTSALYSDNEENIYDIFKSHDLISFEDKAVCLSVLQESFDLEKMLNNFSLLIKKYIRGFSLIFQSAQGSFDHNRTSNHLYSDSYNLSLSSTAERVGTLTYQSNKPLTATENKQLIEFHSLLIPCLRQALQLSELNKLIFKDHLTKVSNRAYYTESIQRAIEQSNRTHQGLALIVLDADDFKEINDTFGHIKGDNALIEFAKVLTEAVRSSDSVFRIGGDEFTLILQPGDHISISKVLNRIATVIEKNMLLKECNFSCSAGFSQWEVGDTAKSMFTRADKALYNKKLLK
ncbi:MAG: GGDEF domain-containing protein [Psychromonas sp.]|nr:GGDEF domain-containing protein [Psychromonas sp.]